MAEARICRNCKFAKETDIVFSGKLHSTFVMCLWGSHHKRSRVPFWMNQVHQTHPDMPRTKRGCGAFEQYASPAAGRDKKDSP